MRFLKLKRRRIPDENPKRRREREQYWAKKYAAFNDFVYGYHIESSLHRKLIRIFGPWKLKGKTVLDVGCGVGSLSLILASKVGKGKVIACDSQKVAIDICREKIELMKSSKSIEEFRERLTQEMPEKLWGRDDLLAFREKENVEKNVAFFEQPVEMLPNANAHLTISRYVLNTYTRWATRTDAFLSPNIGPFIRALERHTRKGGRIVIIDRKDYFDFYSLSQLREMGYRRKTIGNEFVFWKKKRF